MPITGGSPFQPRREPVGSGAAYVAPAELERSTRFPPGTAHGREESVIRCQPHLSPFNTRLKRDGPAGSVPAEPYFILAAVRHQSIVTSFFASEER